MPSFSFLVLVVQWPRPPKSGSSRDAILCVMKFSRIQRSKLSIQSSHNGCNLGLVSGCVVRGVGRGLRSRSVAALGRPGGITMTALFGSAFHQHSPSAVFAVRLDPGLELASVGDHVREHAFARVRVT